MVNTRNAINKIIGDMQSKNNKEMDQATMAQLFKNGDVESYNKIVDWFNNNKETLALPSQMAMKRAILHYKRILNKK